MQAALARYMGSTLEGWRTLLADVEQRYDVARWKPEGERGRYLNPDVFDAPEERGVAHVTGRSDQPTVSRLPSPDRLRPVKPAE